MLQEIGMPIGFFYGSHDWMKREISDFLLEQDLLSEGTSVFTIEDSGHTLFADQPKKCSIELFGFIFGEAAKNSFI